MNNDLKMTVKLDEKKEKYIKFEWNNAERKNCLSFLSIRQENQIFPRRFKLDDDDNDENA